MARSRLAFWYGACWLVVASGAALFSQALAAQVWAGEVKIAVAANFTEPARDISARFEKATGHKVVLSFGATGQFYAQITQGAPFDVLLSADQATPARAVSEGFGIAGSAFTYAVGRLVLYSNIKGFAADGETLRSGAFAKIAIANPALAPYGAAAIEVMKALGVYEALQPKIVQGSSIAQAYQFVETQNAEVGFVALSQIAVSAEGSRWIVPATLHAPLRQDAVLLKAGAGNDTAKAFLSFLRGPEARATLEKFGYGHAD